MTTDTNLQPLAGSVLPGNSPIGGGLPGGGVTDQSAPAISQASQPAAVAAVKGSLNSAKKARERLVLLSIGLVTAATAAMLFVLFEYSFAASVLIGGGVWSALMAVHLQLQKNAEITRLKAEIQRLEALRGQGPIALDRVANELAAGDGERGPRALRGPAKQSAQNGPQANPRWEQAPRGVPQPSSATAQRRAAGEGVTPVVETTLWPGTAVTASDPMRDQWAFRPREGADAAGTATQPAFATGDEGAPRATIGSSPSIDADLAMVQRKIKALADEVNASEIVRDRAGSGPTVPAAKSGGLATSAQASALENSIGELKATAKSMRGGATRSGAARESAPAAAPVEASQVPMQQMPMQQTPMQQAAQQSQSLPFELLIPATAERIAVSKPASGGAVVNEPPLRPAAPTLSIAPDTAAASTPAPGPAPVTTPAPQSFGLPELPSLDRTQAQLIAAMTVPAAPPRNPRLEAIVDALENGEMDVFLSPIVALQSHQVSHYDVTVRLKSANGGYLDTAEQDLQLAGSDFLALFDMARLRRAAVLAQRLDAHNKAGSLLSAVNGPSITNTEFLETFARVFEERDRISNQLVLTFSQADLEQFTPSAWQALGDMQAFGFRFALSQIDHVAMDFTQLASRGFAFLRLEASALMNGLPARDRFIEADELCQYLAGAGMTLVADTIDDEAVRARVFGFGVLFGQGRLFGGARQVKLDQLPKGASAAA